MKPELKDKKMFSFKRLINSFKYAIEGIKTSVSREQNLVIHMFFLVMALIFSIIFKVTKYEFLAVIIVSGLVISLEMINTAIENTVDINKKYSIEAKCAKDAASGAVLVSAIAAIIVGLTIFLPKIDELFDRLSV